MPIDRQISTLHFKVIIATINACFHFIFTSFFPLLFIASSFLFASSLLPAVVEEEKNPQDELAGLKYENDILEAKIQLARSGKFYLIADLQEKKIYLMLKGVPLKEFKVERIEIGRRIFIFIPGSMKTSFKHLYSDGIITPARVIERFQIIPPPPEEVTLREKLPEEEIPPPVIPEPKQISVPHLFSLVFKEGFAMEMISSQVDKESPAFLKRLSSRLKTKLMDVVALFKKGKGAKLRIFIDAESQRAFYRIVPDNINVIIIFRRIL
ncbi:MAG: hypothetical protein AB1756_05535 [Acidobacteriota bacterium]